jgi:di/tricarboxylate transporter
MSPAVLSLLALVAAIVLSCFAPIHVGFLSIALAFLIGHFAAGMTLPAVMAGFPVSLFLTLAGIMLLFSQAGVNGTLEQMARRGVRLARGNRGLIPVVFYLLAVVLGACGPGGIAAGALLAPVAMRVAGDQRIPPFLMTLMVVNGSNAGTFSPIAPTGIIARDLMAKIGLVGVEWANFANTLLAQSVVAFSGYLLLGGARLFREKAPGSVMEALPALTRSQKFTLAVVGALVVSVLAFRVDVGVAAFLAAAVLAAGGAADEERAIQAMPWTVIMLVCGVTMLIHVMDATGGMELFSGLLAGLSGPRFIAGTMALVVGIISVYSSSSGVVMPAFLPTIPSLVEKLGGGNPLMIAYSINVGAHLVDVSPLSTMGAICLAATPATEDRPRLFRMLLVWGWSMAGVGAVVCQLLFGFR